MRSNFTLFSAPAAMLASALVGACAAHAPTENPLANSEWQFVKIDHEAPAEPDKAALSFTAENLSATVGCNGMGGHWRIANGRLIAGPLLGTEMYCAGPIWRQEQAIGSLLVAAPEIEFENDLLIIRSSGHKAILKRVNRLQSGS